MPNRCPWTGNDPQYIAYHDDEWGVPLHDDRRLFEKLSLEAMQAGLSWLTILRKRENFRAAFDHFQPEIVAGYDEDKIAALMADTGIVRNQMKIRAVIHNAGRVLAIQAEHGSLDAFLWRFVEGQTVVHRYATLDDVPAQTDTSKAMSKALKQAGFKFVGPTICYAFMQSVGMVDDHLTTCFRHSDNQPR